jgi:tyrosine-specific transport protein
MSLGKSTLGSKFTFLIFGLYILLFYSLIAAYTKGVGVILSNDLGLTSTSWDGSFLFILIFMPLMYFGTHVIGKVNGFLLLVLLVSFFLLISVGNKNISFDLLTHQGWSQSLFSLPLIISSFGFHGTLPSLVDYLERDQRKIHWAIVIGSTITLVIYFAWELLILGSIPLSGETSLLSAWEHDQTAISPLSQLSGNPLIWNLAHIFSLAAIITSFCGVSISLIDFLVDAFQIKKSFLTKTLLLVSLYVSALLLSMTELRIFYLSLNYGAGIAGIFLLIFLPAFMVYKSNRDGLFFGFSKKLVVSAIFVFSAISLLACLFNLFR